MMAAMHGAHWVTRHAVQIATVHSRSRRSSRGSRLTQGNRLPIWTQHERDLALRHHSLRPRKIASPQ